MLRLLLFSLVMLLPLLSVAQDHRALGRVTVEAVSDDGQRQPITLYEASYALVVGVSDYTNGWKDLPGARNDVPAVKSALEAAGFEVATLLNPDKAALTTAVEAFISDKGQQPASRVVFYFAGHGHTEKLADGRQRGFIVAANAGADPAGNPSAFARGAVSMEQVKTWAEDIRSNHALFVFDSCFAGTIFRSRSNPEIPGAIQTKVARPVRQFIAAGGPDQEVPDQSVFRQMFVRGLSGEADMTGDGYVTGTELGEYLFKEVPEYNPLQTPDHGKLRNPALDQGDVVFALPRGLSLTATSAADSGETPTAFAEDAPSAVVASAAAWAESASATAAGQRSSDGRYIKSSTGVITDTRTNLQWIVGPDRDLDRPSAVAWIMGCAIDGGGWRMPAIAELEGVYQKGLSENNIDPMFALGGGFVWAEKDEYGSPVLFFGSARSLRMGAGDSGTYRVMGVRTVTAADHRSSDGRYIKSSTGVITDTTTNLQWIVGPDRDTNYSAAEAWVRNYTVDGGGWRMPTQAELKALYENGRGERNIDPLFAFTGWWVWAEERDSSSAWLFSFSHGLESPAPRSYSGSFRVLGVRASP